MTVFSLYSGSSGNSIYLKQNNTELLIDAGGSMKQLQEALKSVGSSLERLSAILITHEHSDHTKAIPILCKHVSVPIYCQRDVAKELYLDLLHKNKREEASALARQIRTVDGGMEYEVGEVSFAPFHTPHDSVDCLGFVFGERELGIATDIGHLSDEAQKYLLGCKNVILESNYDEDMLFTGPYPPYLRERVASSNGHLDNRDCAAFAARLLQAGMENLTLFHLSQENNTEELARKTSEEALVRCGAVLQRDICLQVAHRYERTKIL